MARVSDLTDIHPIDGIRLGSVVSGVAKHGRDDLSLVDIAAGASVAAVFTRNALCAAPVTVARQHLGHGNSIRGLLINTGSANAATGDQGLADTHASLDALAQHFECAADSLMPFSTGVIGERLKIDRMINAVPALIESLSEDGWQRAASAIMTTDTRPKASSRRETIANGRSVTVTGIAKGAGMIRPDMATMLAFVACDAAIAPDRLQAILDRAVAASFNRITVDGDTSTNDACVLIATGTAMSHAPIDDAAVLAEVEVLITELCQDLARQIVRDGEGATKFITVEVQAARTAAEARQVAYTIAHSPLVKTACHAEDPNWGRILAAVGRSGLEALDMNRVSLRIDDVALITDGQPVPDYREADAAAVMQQAEFVIAVALGRGDASDEVWTCDLSADYVRINADYRS